MKRSSLLLVILLLLSQGCSTTWVQHRQTWNAGWRNGVVLQIDQPDPYASACRPDAAESAPAQMASVEYVQAKRRHRAWLPIADGGALKPGDRVRFNRISCTVISDRSA